MKSLLFLICFFGLLEETHATVFNLPHFLRKDEVSYSVEPVVYFTGKPWVNDNSYNLNLRYSRGISDLSNFVGIIGVGTENRAYNFGGAATFDLFPDLESQPGIGIAVQGLFVKIPGSMSFEFSGIPYIHKFFDANHLTQIPLEPFAAIPVGVSLANGNYKMTTSVSLGTFMHFSRNWRAVLEAGIPVANSAASVSGGVVYQP